MLLQITSGHWNLSSKMCLWPIFVVESIEAYTYVLIYAVTPTSFHPAGMNSSKYSMDCYFKKYRQKWIIKERLTLELLFLCYVRGKTLRAILFNVQPPPPPYGWIFLKGDYI